MGGLKYKVGDRIKLKKDSTHYKHTSEHIKRDEFGTIIQILDEFGYHSNRHKYGIRWKNRVYPQYEVDCYLRKIDIELVKIRATKLAKKVYPNAAVKDGWLEIY